MILVLPWPPSVNQYWRAFARGNRVCNILSEKGRNYRAATEHLGTIHGRMPAGVRLAVRVEAYPPDRRKRDLDNLLKAILDSLTHAGVYEDDSLVDELTIVRKPIEKGGRVQVYLRELLATRRSSGTG